MPLRSDRSRPLATTCDAPEATTYVEDCILDHIYNGCVSKWHANTAKLSRKLRDGVVGAYLRREHAWEQRPWWSSPWAQRLSWELWEPCQKIANSRWMSELMDKSVAKSQAAERVKIAGGGGRRLFVCDES